MPLVDITLSIDENIKKQAENIFNEIGIDVSTAINIFIRQAIRTKGIPFEIKMEDKTKEEELLDLLLEAKQVANDESIKSFSSAKEAIEYALREE